jgi:hypothetical protein
MIRLAIVIVLTGLAGSAHAGGDWAARLIARTDAIAAEIGALRGLAPRQPIRRDVMEVGALRERLVARFAEEYTPEQIAAEQLALERWGLVPPGVRIHEVLLDVLSEQIAGFYDPKDGTLYIAARPGDASDESEAWADMLMAHEIVHALQDQHFDLRRLTDLPRTEGDALLARQALVEGDGVVAMIELSLARQGVAPPWGMADAVTMLMRTMEVGDGEAGQLARAPLVVRDLLMFPYARGMRFVAALRARHPWKRVDEVFRQPPASTEQILHPELYLAGEAPHQVTAATPAALSGWRTLEETVWGEAGWSVILRQHGVDPERAATAAAGWGGDRAVVYGRGDAPVAGRAARHAVAIGLTSWDTDLDALEFEEAAVLALDRLVTGTIIEERRGRTVWLGADARVSLVERVDDRVLVVVGAPLATLPTLAADVWAAWTVTP